MRHLLDPALDLVRDVRDDLDGFSEVVAAAFFGDDLAVDFAGGDVVVGGKGDGEEAFVVSEVEVRFSSVVEDEALFVVGIGGDFWWCGFVLIDFCKWAERAMHSSQNR